MCALVLVYTPIDGSPVAVPQPLQGVVGTTAKFGTVALGVKFRVDVSGRLSRYPFQAVRKPPPVVSVAVTLTANARTCGSMAVFQEATLLMK
ncbi:hypothetical protein GCM10027610_115880 [Dactylosporangium cerinum]